MKRLVLLLLVLLLILVVPIPTSQLRDGGTRCYTSLTYKIVCWHRLLEDGTIYNETSFYLPPEKSLTLDELFELELQRKADQ